MSEKKINTSKSFPIYRVMNILRREMRLWKEPIVTRISRADEDPQRPFRILVSTVLSLRTKDDCTAAASERLFALAQ